MLACSRLLAATDLSAGAARAVDRAAAIAAANQGALDLVHVARYSGEDALDGLVRGMPRHTSDLIRQEAQDTLDVLAVTVGDSRGVAATTCVAVGPLLSTIAARAAAVAADLVVVGAGSSGRGGWASTSTAERLAGHLAPPVLVVRRDANAGYRRVLVGVDLVQPSLEALELASRVAPDAELVVAHTGRALREDAPRIAAGAGALQPQPRGVLAPVPVQPAQWILQCQARRACDLVVLLRQPADSIERVLLQSVAWRILVHGGADVLVARTPATTGMRSQPRDRAVAG